jgi:hypothetical protein
MEMSVRMLEEVLIVRLKWFGWRRNGKKWIWLRGWIYEDKPRQASLFCGPLQRAVKRRRESFPSPSNMP